LIIESAGGEPTTSTGALVKRAPKVRSRKDVIPVLMSTYPNRGREPYWSSPHESIDAATRLKIVNSTSVTAAFGVTPSPLPNIRVTRNFIAHRNEHTARDLQSLAVGLGLSPRAQVDDIVNTRVVPGISLFERWILELRFMAEAAVV